MDKIRLFKTLAYLIILIFLVNFIAHKLYWYFSIWWFDMPMHFFGGAFIGLSLIWFFYNRVQEIGLSLSLIYKIIAGVLIIGVSWEIFEIIFNNLLAHDLFNVLDTISDVFFDLAGGTLAVLYYFFYLKKISLNKENKL